MLCSFCKEKRRDGSDLAVFFFCIASINLFLFFCFLFERGFPRKRIYTPCGFCFCFGFEVEHCFCFLFSLVFVTFP